MSYFVIIFLKLTISYILAEFGIFQNCFSKGSHYFNFIPNVLIFLRSAISLFGIPASAVFRIFDRCKDKSNLTDLFWVKDFLEIRPPNFNTGFHFEFISVSPLITGFKFHNFGSIDTMIFIFKLNNNNEKIVIVITIIWRFYVGSITLKFINKVGIYQNSFYGFLFLRLEKHIIFLMDLFI